MTDHTFQESTCYTVENTQSTTIIKCTYGPVGHLSPLVWAMDAFFVFMIGYMLFRLGKSIVRLFKKAAPIDQTTVTSSPSDRQA